MRYQRQSESAVLDKADGLDGLTSKQQLFIAYCFAGMNDNDAYRAAYAVEHMSPGALGVAANRVRHNVNVALKLRELQDRRDELTTLAPQLTRDFIINGLMGLARFATKESVQLGAYSQLGKIAGIDLFRETTRIERVERTVDQVDAELRQRLKDLQPVIEGEAHRVDKPAPVDRRRKPKA